jgi:diamine N-acetyltransferase
MEITLQAINPDNWEECIALNVQPHQERLTVPNVSALARSKVFPDSLPLAIYAGRRIIGFMVYQFAPDDDIPWIDHFMIDQKYQGKGYGRAALQEAIMLIEAQSERSEIKIALQPDNTVAERLFRSLSFEPTGEMQDSKTVMRLHLQ